MAMKRGKTVAGVAAVLGITAAVLWLRDFINFLRGDGRERQLQAYAQRRMVQARMTGAPIPASGGVSSETVVAERAAVEAEQRPLTATASDSPVIAPTPPQGTPLLESMTAALVQYLITFHNLVVLARSRRKEAAAHTGGSSLTPEDWQVIDQQLRSLEAKFPEYDPDVLRTNYAQRHIYLLLHKVRGAMYSTRLSDEELFRIYGEVRSEACPVLDETPSTDADYQFARSLYDCS